MKPTYEELAQAARDCREKQKALLRLQITPYYPQDAVQPLAEAWAAAYTLDRMLAQLADGREQKVGR